jgi:1-aminocyclopropane-1-carboxylate deaminase/D-cysteine desulfhydrase-like pyridoxal-dependent ACC family enzyme/DNA modification methylase
MNEEGFLFGNPYLQSTNPNMFDRFIIPPFTVLDSRQGYWQDRKRRWINIGIRSEIGRDDAELYGEGSEFTESGTTEMKTKTLPHFGNDIQEKYHRKELTAASVFDPVLCEIVYRWFLPKGGSVLDPFAGGSVRGIVASMLGYNYTGVDLRQIQVDANNQQAHDILGSNKWYGGDEYTPIEIRGNYFFKREDLYSYAGVHGGKVRTAMKLAQGAKGLITAGSRSSPQVNIVAHIAKELGIPCRVHTPRGELPPELLQAQACGAEIIQEDVGYNNVIISRAEKDAAEHPDWTYIPFGMECKDAVVMTASQVIDIPNGVKRIVVPVGSGITLAGVLWGLRQRGIHVPVVGIVVGADPTSRLNDYAPLGWEQECTLLRSPLEYSQKPRLTSFEGIKLDPVYEAKCIDFLKQGDLLWVVGIHETEMQKQIMPQWRCGDSLELDKIIPASEKYDLMFTCPPYHDMEVYSDDPRDLSNMKSYDKFIGVYGTILGSALMHVKKNRFAVVVVSDIRDVKTGFIKPFVQNTIEFAETFGFKLYNHAVLFNVCGTLPLRTGRHFSASRKMGKMHQDVLVFFNGDPAAIKKEFGDVEFGEEAENESRSS